MEYQVTIHKTITLSRIVEADNAADAATIGRETMIIEDETYFVEETHYSEPEVYELETEKN
jgi:hypothetical protein